MWTNDVEVASLAAHTLAIRGCDFVHVCIGLSKAALPSLPPSHPPDSPFSSPHPSAVRCIKTDRTRILSAGDDKRLLVFDKATARMQADLRGHEDAVSGTH